MLARYLHEPSYREIARALHISELAARMRCMRARAQLRAIVEQSREEESALRKAMSGLALGVSADFTARVLNGVRSRTPAPAAPAAPPTAPLTAHGAGWHAAAQMASWKVGTMLLGLAVIGGGALLLHHAHRPAAPRPRVIAAAAAAGIAATAARHASRLPALTGAMEAPPSPLPVAPSTRTPLPAPPGSTAPMAAKPVAPQTERSPMVTTSLPATQQLIAQVPPSAPATATPAIAKMAQGEQMELAPVEGFNLKIIGRPSPTMVEVQPDPHIHNWFAGKFVHLPVGEQVEIRVVMTGCDTPGNVADTAKWKGLRPVYTYADPEQYASYEWFRRDAAGRWASSDPFKRGAECFAGAGKTPAQGAIPAALADTFLSADGRYWSPWGEIEGGSQDTATRTFTFSIRPAMPEMTIAMHVPYLPSYDRQLAARLQAAHLPGVYVDKLGSSAGGRPLRMIRVDDPEAPAAVQITPVEKPTWYFSQRYARSITGELESFPTEDRSRPMTDAMPVVRVAPPPGSDGEERRLFFLDAREDASEQTASWVVIGALRALTADTPEAVRLRRHATWLLLPLFDQDGAAAAEFNPRFRQCDVRQATDHNQLLPVALPEVLDYLSYLRAFVSAGWLFTTSASFFGLECNEASPVCCPAIESDAAASQSAFIVADKESDILAFNRYWFDRLQATGVPAGPKEPWFKDHGMNNLASGCSARYCALTMIFEINDRYPGCRFTQEGLQGVGADYPSALMAWLALPEGQQVLARLRTVQQQRRETVETHLEMQNAVAHTVEDHLYVQNGVVHHVDTISPEHQLLDDLFRGF